MPSHPRKLEVPVGLQPTKGGVAIRFFVSSDSEPNMERPARFELACERVEAFCLSNLAMIAYSLTDSNRSLALIGGRYLPLYERNKMTCSHN